MSSVNEWGFKRTTFEEWAVQPIGEDISTRLRSAVHLLRWLYPNPNLPAAQYGVSVLVWKMAVDLLSSRTNLVDSAELTMGLRKLLEAKDCLVRASMLAGE